MEPTKSVQPLAFGAWQFLPSWEKAFKKELLYTEWWESFLVEENVWPFF